MTGKTHLAKLFYEAYGEFKDRVMELGDIDCSEQMDYDAMRVMLEVLIRARRQLTENILLDS